MEKFYKYPVFYILLTIILTGLAETFTDVIDSFNNFLLKPTSWIYPLKTNEHPFVKVIFFGITLLMYYFIVRGILNFILGLRDKPITKNEHLYKFEKYLMDAIVDIEKNASDEKIKESVTNFMNHFEDWIGSILKLSSKHYKCYWILPNEETDLFLISTGTINNEISDLLDFITRTPKSRHFDTNVGQHMDEEPIEELMSVRNFGELKLGFAVLIYKNNVLDEQIKQEFLVPTSYLLLMGFNEKLTQAITTVRR